MPTHARRAAMKEAIGKARAYLTARAAFQKSGKKQGTPGFPGAADHPTDLTGSLPPEGKVFLPRRPTHGGEVGQAVLLSGVSLPGQC
jgi:hypothetical protein